MTMPPLPAAFARRIAGQLGDAAPAYFQAMEQPPVRGLRINPHKPTDAPLVTLVEGISQPVPWQENAYLLALQSAAGAHPLHEAGAYYLQEPSAMLPATLLRKPAGLAVLDLCAAPGGKSTQLAAAMAGCGTLVCNEPVPTRAQVLSRNLERMGVTNAAVVCADPAALAERWPQLFDMVLVDAPCSGEGMFRRHPETRLEWDAEAPARCALRQTRILHSAVRMLKTGGQLCYSTCTLNTEENEQVLQSLQEAYPMLTPLPFTVHLPNGQSLSAPMGQVRLYPHQVAGEGHFAALLQKCAPTPDDAPRACALMPPAYALNAPTKQATEGFFAFWQGLSADVPPQPNAMLGDALLAAPPLPPLAGIRVLRAGLTLGQLKGRIFVPDHALAMAAPAWALPAITLDTAAALRYQGGESLPAPDALRGYATVTLHGLALGFVKASDGQLKNHYPKGLRRP